MTALFIILFSTLSQEVADSFGKKAAARRQASAYGLAFLGFFWVAVFMAGSLLVGAEFRLQAASLPTLVPRIVLECAIAYLSAVSVIRMERSAMGFLRLLTIPLLLATDLIMGYRITVWEMLGIGLLLAGMAWVFSRSRGSRKGGGYVVLLALVGVATASLYKYDITHFNSIAGEQLVVALSVMLFFSVVARLKGLPQPIRLVAKPLTGTQSLAGGLAFAVESFAYMYAAPSVIVSIKRGLALLWSIAFGHKWFNERGLAVKLRAASIAVAGLVLLALL
jgi:hypothetical protein